MTSASRHELAALISLPVVAGRECRTCVRDADLDSAPGNITPLRIVNQLSRVQQLAAGEVKKDPA